MARFELATTRLSSACSTAVATLTFILVREGRFELTDLSVISGVLYQLSYSRILYLAIIMVGSGRIELPTFAMSRRRSTTKLRTRIGLSSGIRTKSHHSSFFATFHPTDHLTISLPSVVGLDFIGRVPHGILWWLPIYWAFDRYVTRSPERRIIAYFGGAGGTLTDDLLHDAPCSCSFSELRPQTLNVVETSGIEPLTSC